MARIPSIIRTFGSYFQQKRKAKIEANKKRKQKTDLERQLRQANESSAPNSIAANSKMTADEVDILKIRIKTSTNKSTKNRKKNKVKEKIRKEKSHNSRSVHLIYTPMGNKR